MVVMSQPSGPPQQPPPGPPYLGGQPQYSPNPPSGNRRGLLILLVGLLVVAIGVVVALVVVVVRAGGSDESSPRTKPADPAAVEFRRVLTAAQGTCPTPAPEGTACDAQGMRYTLGKAELDGRNVAQVKAAQREDGRAGWYVGLTLDDDGARRFEQLTSEVSKNPPPTNQLAIVVRGQVVAAPSVQSAIAGGQVEISGSYTRKTAEELATKITG
jgi:preprotein translocase subunit SecD